MNTEANRQAAIHLMATTAAADIDFSDFAEDATWWTPTQGHLDIPRFKQRLAEIDARMAGPGAMDILCITAEGDRVAMEVRGALPTKDGRIYANLYHFLIEFRDGRIICVKQYCDSAYVREFFYR